jgi:hypothetical protein
VILDRQRVLLDRALTSSLLVDRSRTSRAILAGTHENRISYGQIDTYSTHASTGRFLHCALSTVGV